MRAFFTNVVLVSLLFSSVLTNVFIAEPVSAADENDAILRWNAVSLQAVVVDHTPGAGVPGAGLKENVGPTMSARALAIIHLAMFDAANAIEHLYTPYLEQPLAATGALTDVAIATAAHRTLSALYPAQFASFDQALSDDLSLVPDGDDKTAGIAVGEAAAELILASRVGDGDDIVGGYVSSDLPGHWRPDPLHPEQTAYGDYYGSVRPFLMPTVEHFLVPEPPALTSAEYTAAYNEVKELGSIDSASRTEEQTQIGIFWGYDGSPGLGVPPRLYNQITRGIAIQQGNTKMQNAKLFALVNLAMIDGGIASWNAKYDYDYWRPVTAIRESDEGTGPSGLGDGNLDTIGDPDWTPLGAPASNPQLSSTPEDPPTNFSPPFPAYTSGHATFGSAAFASIAHFYGTDDISFTFTSDEYNGITLDQYGHVRPLLPRSFTSLSQAAYENANSRIYLGIHWSFDRDEGLKNGKQVADYIFDSFALPLSVDEGSSSSSTSEESSSSSSVSSSTSSVSDDVEHTQAYQKNHAEQILSHSYRGHGTTEAAMAMHYLAELHGITPDAGTSTASLPTVFLVAAAQRDASSDVVIRPRVVRLGKKNGETVVWNDSRTLTQHERAFLCSMQKFLHQDARATRMSTLMPWASGEMTSMLNMSPEAIENMLHDDSLCSS